ncbi:TspO/MBR family protein [Alkalicoccus halolimnae]|uniref:TspO/MBR family protein n=1 Tax=Alkalicoccus halolimnae TaxID=1667239 RepID=A0A5C7F4V1_9BACI|nr:TspO/MBR family protein [Alkalicoccus halolimnae]TXF85093.1 tryptophan-rich sensory protein [Alkalicoccus halolimnae]
MIRQFAVINLAVLLVVITINVLANTLPLNNLTTGQLSERVNVLFTPAGYVFSIWSLIYLTLFLWAVRGLYTRRGADLEAISRIGFLFAWSGLFNVLWLFLFHFEFYVLTLFPMVALLTTIIFMYYHVDRTEGVTIWTKLPFSIYLGWVSVATIVNIGIFFNSIGLNEGFIFSNITWTVLVLFVGGGIAYAFTRIFRDAVYGLVFVWAFLGIAVERTGESIVIAFFAALVGTALLAYIVYYVYTTKKMLEFEA